MDTMTDEQRMEFTEAAEPLVKWLCENCHPHVYVIVDPIGAELVEGVMSVKIEEHLKD